MTSVVTLRELSSRVGVEFDDLQQMIRLGSIPEASKQPNAAGDIWVVPVDALPDLAERHGWSIDTVDLTEDGRPTVWMSAQETTESKELVVHPDGALAPDAELVRSDEEVTVAEIIDGALLNRLLGAHEERAEAEARSRESQRAMTAMAAGQQRMVRELAEERYERQRVNDRFRDERTARMTADAKMAELHARLDHEAALAERERQARHDATTRSIKAEREAAAALASMSWLARRKLQRRLDELGGRLP